jgi:hypothetical protein
MWLLNLDQAGAIVGGEYRNYGLTDQNDIAYCLREYRSNGAAAGYIFAGATEYFLDRWIREAVVWIVESDFDLRSRMQFGAALPGDSGNSANSEIRWVEQTSDGGFIMAGWTDLYDIDSTDMWVVKLNANFTTQWERLFDRGHSDRAYSVRQVSGGRYIVAGSSFNNESGNDDFILIMLDSDGLIIETEGDTGPLPWERTYSGVEGSFDEIRSVDQTYDGGFIFTGNSQSLSGKEHIWIMKLDRNGHIPVDYRAMEQAGGGE